MIRKMTAIVVLLLTSAILAGCVSQQERAFQSVEGKKHSAVRPVQRSDKGAVEWWGPRQDAVNERLKKGNADLLFIGDSITQGWEDAGREIWDAYYARRNAVNMGFSGDRTEHVLWRLEHSNFEAISPKLAVVMIGTNNPNRAEQVADGIITICKQLRSQLPNTKILLLAIFPRNHNPSPQRQKNVKASLLASKVADNKTIYYLDINNRFLTKDGLLNKDIMPD
ncbi:MAG: GDSL-type esterase/lipase family protein, partial [Sedimentisphaerales bacterium]|nr:GDSL-type esterase/lipase family protein [Sedimentisphaerales bacterium]